jgi:hypothetical protein
MSVEGGICVIRQKPETSILENPEVRDLNNPENPKQNMMC